MSKQKRVSAEEKRARILQIFHESQDFFQLKDVEKIASKEKGINAQYVKDIVQNLVDDALVDSDKIGTSVYYWSYLSKALNSKKRKLAQMESQIEDTSQKLKITKEKLDKEKAGKEESEQMLAILEEIQKLTDTEKELTEKIQIYKDNDPEVLQKMKEDIKVLKEAVNRWTDNIFAIKSWCKNKFSIDEKLLDKQFEIPPDLDYVDV